VVLKLVTQFVSALVKAMAVPEIVQCYNYDFYEDYFIFLSRPLVRQDADQALASAGDAERQINFP